MKEVYVLEQTIIDGTTEVVCNHYDKDGDIIEFEYYPSVIEALVDLSKKDLKVKGRYTPVYLTLQ